MPATRATLLCHYRYDALDRLTGQGLTDAPPLQRFYCKSRLATEIQGALRQTLFQHGDWLLAQQQQQGVEHDTTLLAIDQQRSVLNTLKANHQAQPIAYAPYGHRQATNGWMSLMGFNGERPDPLTGHYLLGNGYRAFNPVLMRFNSPDSLSPFGKGGLNSYAYCSSDPINASDPTGHVGFFGKILSSTAKLITVENGPGHVSKHYLKPGISITQGEIALREIDDLLINASVTPQQNSLFLERLNNHRNSSLNLNTKTLKLVKSTAHSIEGLTEHLPPKLIKQLKNTSLSNDEHTLLEYIKNDEFGINPYELYAFSDYRLSTAQAGDSPSSLKLNRDVANRFSREIHSLVNPNKNELMKQVELIRKKHFSKEVY